MAETSEHPRDPQAKHRFLCTPSRPMPPNAPGQWSHESVRSDGSDSSYWDGYVCNACGTRFKVEVPE